MTRFFMNFKIIDRSTFIIFCLFCIVSIQLGGKWNINALAQDSSSISKPLNSLSSQQKANLEEGMVVLQGSKGNYLGQVLATGDINTAWEVITDYNNFARFLPNVASSKIITEENDRVVFEQVNVVDLWLFEQEFQVEIEANKKKPTQIDFKIVDGDLKKLVGRWEISDFESDRVMVSHKVEVEPGSNTEKPFFYGVYESSLEDTLKAIALEIDRRSQK